ncbi:unnamed protein product [Miscanthus lutarioriparius]|uniref:Glycosyltransferase n=1 Tax=Miscanthus lutarioriparius TaxID=422564 RepID=A0A811QPA6_9POAL|nr:unnamed protein product [Miscanthus lutarioriparius]
MAASPHRPRLMMLPFAAQGHVMPFMELSYRLVEHGFEVVFVNTDFNHARMLTALAGTSPAGGIDLISFPDGMGPDGDRTDIGKVLDGLLAAMLGGLEETIRSRNIRWVVADLSMSFVLELVHKVGVRVALFSTFSVATFALGMHLPKMIEDGIIDEMGNVKRNERVQPNPKMPAIDASKLPWITLGKSPESRRAMIQCTITTNPTLALADTIVCNTFQEIESVALAHLPIPAAPGSVVYVAFGSLMVFDAERLQELADGLALTGRPFLWVVRPNFADGVGEGWLDGFRRRIGDKGLVVGWAPQQRVLSHPSVACFVTHCGWNSTMEAVRHGIALLCWPYFADQFLNQSYICDLWGVALKVCADGRGIVTKDEVRDKVERLLGDDEINARTMVLKSAACASVADGGSSHQYLLKLVNLLREN